MSHRAVCFSLIVHLLCASLVPAAAVAAVNQGMLYVKSEPSGAKVFIDSEERGTTPAFIRNVEPGRRTVELRLAGALATRQVVTVEAGKIAKLNVRLAREPGSLTVVSEPLEATVFLDRRDCGETPLTIERVEPGAHEVIVYKDDYERAVRKVEIEPGESQILEIALRPKGAAPAPERAERELDTTDEAEKRCTRVLGEFETFVKKGDYVSARGLVKRGAKQEEFADIAAQLRAAAKVACALEDRREAIREGARALAGQDVTLQTKGGPRKGKVEQVTEEGISLSAQIRLRGRVAGTTSFTLPWSDLTPAQEELLATGWDRGSADARIGRAFLALARSDLAAAGRAVHGTLGHPLADYVRGRIEAVKRAPSEAAARKAWGEIEKLAKAPDLSAIEARNLRAKLDSFEREHGKTEHAASVRTRIAEVREVARRAFPRAAGAPPDAVEFEGHWYKLYAHRVPWTKAKRFCEEQRGHLVTITSRGEQDFLARLVGGTAGSIWIGFTDATRQQRWEWVTGEKVTFQAWKPGEPNNQGGTQDYAVMWDLYDWLWDDRWDSEGNRFICEWELPAAGRTRRPRPVERATEGAVVFGGHVYKLFEKRMTWHEAKSFCQEQRGHLVTITSRAENEFVTGLARKADTDAWIGLTDEKQEGRWEWVTGEKVNFTAWAPLQPDNMDGVQHYVRLWRRRAFAWDDDRAFGHVGPTPFICEWDSTVRKPPRMPDRVARAFEAPPGEPAETETVGGRGGGRFRELPQERSILMGFKLWIWRFGRNTIIKALQAVYLTRTGETRGRIRGQPAGRDTTVVARPGFAVGAIEGRGGARVNGFRILFMQMNGTALDPGKWYRSERIGGRGGGPERRPGGGGKYVIGRHGGSGADVDRIGLIADP